MKSLEQVMKKCQICIGCGRCNADLAGLHVLTKSFLKTELLPVGETAGKGSFVLVDLGTTTIAMELYGEDGKKLDEYVRSNPQRIFGADVISRIQAAENIIQAKQMQNMVFSVLTEGLKAFGEKRHTIKQIYIAGNTTMLYLLCGHDVQPLGYAPFLAEHLKEEKMMLGDIPAYTLPGISAFVGGDVLAGILACKMHKREEITLLIDLGTNGEMVLGNKDRLLVCSTAAGPAFEGMLHAKGKAVWGADVVEYIATLLDRHIVDETGLLIDPYFEKGITIGGVQISQDNIRSLQMAKAAIATGIQALMSAYHVQNADVKKIYLAGGFGYYLKEEAAIKIGLLPEFFRGKMEVIGNSALAGGYQYHMCSKQGEEVKCIKKISHVINLTEMEAFTKKFVDNMNLKALI